MSRSSVWWRLTGLSPSLSVGNPPPLPFLTVDVAVFVNKSLLSGSLSEAPLFVTWYQCVVTVLGCYVLRQAARYLPGKISFPELDLDVNIMKEVM